MSQEPNSTNGGHTPIGTVLMAGSSDVILTPREWQIAELVAAGKRHKQIAGTLHITANNVGDHIATIAARIPGDGAPRLKVAAWMWEYGAVQSARH